VAQAAVAAEAAAVAAAAGTKRLQGITFTR
jgi:hypothetical protein